MTDNPVRVGPALDPRRFLATDETVWFGEVLDVPLEEQLLGLPEDQRFAADVDGADPESYPGVYAVYPMTLVVPGHGASTQRVPVAGLTWVGVHPDHRRRGVLTAMLRHHFEQVHETPDTWLSALHASEPGIYGRHGYGLASVELEVKLGRGTTLHAPHLEDAVSGITTRMGTVSDADVPKRMRESHLATAALGSVVGEPAYYDRVCQLLPEQLRDKEPWRVMFARRDGVDVGWAMFRRSHHWDRGRPSGELSVWALVGEPAAQLALLRRLLDFDLMGAVKLKTGADDPLLHWAGGPRGTSDIAIYDSLWVRLVDLPEALQARTWSAPCDVVVDVADRSAPWNQGTWRVVANSDGTAVVERTSAEPDLRLETEALGAAYLGGGNLLTLHQAGLVAEERAGSVAELARAMRTDLPPTWAVMF